MIIVLNGPINSGKTTVAKILWEKIPNCAYIEVDKIREFIDWMDNEPAWTIAFDTALSVAKDFIEKNLNVLITYHISDKGYESLVKKLKPLDSDIFAFTFKPPLTTVLTYRGTREIDKRDKSYIRDSYKRNLEDWQRLCSSCHKIYDLENGLTTH